MSKTSTRPQTKQQRRQDRRQDQKRQQAAKATGKNRRMIIGIISALILVALVVTISIFLRQGTATGTGAGTIASDNPAYPSIDGIPCQSHEVLDYHVHAHLTIYVNGKNFPLPTNLGIASDQSCFYWLHTHDSTGVIHIEAPSEQSFTLNTFFQEWSTRFPQMTYPTELDSTSGWQVYVDGKPYTGDFHSITLVAHKLITLAYNSPGIKPDTTYAWQGL
ncbi:MAG: hypothetical protein H0V70_16930 [Ktedonobacteraceae bacterium]|nr:hypothetical protein [Ktedonobacteraceae bacterium]